MTSADWAKPSTVDRLSHALSGYDIFVSYSRRDSQYALALAQSLADMGLDVFWDQFAALPGREVPSDVLKALYRSRLIVVLTSQYSVCSNNVADEIHAFRRTGGRTLFVSIDGRKPLKIWTNASSGSARLVTDGPSDAAGVPGDVVRRAILGDAKWPRTASRVRAVLAVAVAFCVVALWLADRSLSARRQADAKAGRAASALRVATARKIRDTQAASDATQAAMAANARKSAAQASEETKRKAVDSYKQFMDRMSRVLTLRRDRSESIQADGVFQFSAKPSGDHHKLVASDSPDDPVELMVLIADGFTLPVDHAPFVFEYPSTRPFHDAYVVLLLKSGRVDVEHLDVWKLEHSPRSPTTSGNL